MKPLGLFKRGRRVPTQFLFWEAFRSTFQSTLLKHAGDFFFVLRNADFFKFKKRLGTLLRKGFAHKSSAQRVNNASWLISYFDVLLWVLRLFCIF